MSDAPRPQESVEQRLGLVARGVQRMADAFGSLEQRLSGVADAEGLQALSDRTDEYRVRARAEVAAIGERIEKLEAEQQRALDLLRAIGSSIEAVAARSVAPAGVVDLSGPMDHLIEAVRGLRDDLTVAIGELRVETAASVERIVNEQSSRLARLHDALSAARESPTVPRLDDLQRVLDEVLAEVRSVHGEVAAASGQLRTDIAADVASLRETIAPPAPPLAPSVDDGRLAAIENVIASLRDELAIDRLEASMRDMAQDTSGLRADVRRSFDRVLHEISTTEESIKGEVRAIDSRLTGFGDDLRLVRGLRDGLEALASGVDAVRQLAARSATSSQMGELAHDLSTVLAEIETARSQVLSVDQQVGRLQASAIDLQHAAPGPDIAREVEELERTVTDGIADLGARIEAIAERTVAASEPEDPLTARLRTLATSARQLSMGIAEDLKARRGTTKKVRKPAQQR